MKLSIDYIESTQQCQIAADKLNDDWKRVRSFYNQISDQSEIFETYIQIPWHVFISNLNVLADVTTLYSIELSFSTQAQARLSSSVDSKRSLTNIQELPRVSEEEIQTKLDQLGFKRILTAEQKRNLSKLSRLQIGATFSVPGAGKTTEAIAFYLYHKVENQKLLVICPKNAFSAWEEQIAVCLPELPLKTQRLTQGITRIQEELENPTNDVFLISYQQFNRCSDLLAQYLHHNQTFVFIDESHRMKGGDKTDTGRQIQKISHLPIGKLIMSGTPMPQSLADLIPQYNFLFPSDGDVSIENVQEKIRRIYVRTTKNEILNPHDFPLKIVRTEIPLHEPQRHLYNLIRSEEMRQLSGIGSDSRRLFRQLGKSYIRLLQVVTNPSLLLKTLFSYPDELREAIEYGDGNKIRYTALKARQLAKEGKKVLIWSGFVENVETLTQMLSDLGARCIHGGVEAGSDEEEDTRERIVKDFHDDPNRKVLVANPAACSEGISLHTVCHHSIYLDRNYNAAQFLQSMDRIHRLGLIKGTETIIEVVHSPDSIDDLINARLSDKVRRMAHVMQDPSLNIEPVTVDLNDEGFDEEDAKELLKHLKGLK